MSPLVDWGFQFVDATGSVEVQPDSAAARAGLQTGDRVLAIEDVPLARYTRAHHEAIERSQHPVALQLNRAGRLVTIRVPLKVVVP
jgi:predicted metalloprotease with PDZ domain